MSGYVLPLIFSAVLSLMLAIVIVRNHATQGSRALASLVIGTGVWSAGYAMEFLAPGLEAKLFWAKFQYFGIATIPLTWFIFAIQHLGSPTWQKRSLRYLSILWVIPIVTILLVWTNTLHGLVWESVGIMDMGPVQMLEIHHAPWFWIYWIYAHVLILIGSFRLVGGALASVRLYRWQIILTVLASLVPWVGNLLYVLDASPVEHLDLTPFGFIIASLFFTISLFRFRLVRIMPIAHRAVFAGLTDCLLVLDLQDCIVDLNPAARHMTPYSGSLLGKSLDEVFPELADWIAPAGFTDVFRVEVMHGEEADSPAYELTVSPLKGPYPRPVGRLVVCHEITQHKLEQTRLEQARAELEQLVSERTKALSFTVEQLQRELTERALAEKRFEDVIEAAPDAMLLIDQSGSIRLVNAQVEKLFGYAREALLDKNIAMLIPMDRRNVHAEHMRRYAANPVVRRVSFDLDLIALHEDGRQFPVEISLGPLETTEGVWVACTVRDISERKQAERDLKRLLEEISTSREQLRALTNRLQQVQEFERRQIATELHDRIGQNLTGLNLNLQILGDQMSSDTDQNMRSRLEDSLQLVEETTRQVRDVMSELRPPMLDEYGLFSALNWYGGRFARRSGIATLVIGGEFDPRLSPEIELVLFRIAQEALNNVVRHAQASEVQIVFESAPEAACLMVSDNGLGFDVQNASESATQPHWGLINIEQRAISIGGELTIDSTPGRGTRLTITLKRSQDES